MSTTAGNKKLIAVVPDSSRFPVSALPHESEAQPRADSRRPFDESTRGPRGPRLDDPYRWRVFHVHNRPKPRRCQASTVSGLTRTIACRQPLHARDSHTQRIRRGQTNPRGARAIQDRQLMPEREDFEVQRRTRSSG